MDESVKSVRNLIYNVQDGQRYISHSGNNNAYYYFQISMF